ncbi:MAG: metallophosphoesterase [Nitrospirae bacterium]|nr:metallophosphoesterase [Candidatus Manganitrophaceae bacterium]
MKWIVVFFLFFLFTTASAQATSDTFDRPNSTDLGSGWNEYLINLDIFNNQLRNSNAGSKATQFTPAIGPNQDVSTDCKVTAAGNMCAVMARWADANNFYYARLDASAGDIKLFKVVNGASTPLGTAVRSLQLNTYYKIRLVFSGSSLKLYFANESTPALSVTDTSLTAGNYAGIRSYASAADTTWFNNFSAVSINRPPVARLSNAPASGEAPLTIHFDGTASSDADGTIAAYRWDFGDGTTETAAAVDHTYYTAGTYTVKLTVTDNAGATASTQVKITTDSICPGPTRLPYIAFMTPTSATLAWECDTDGTVTWGAGTTMNHQKGSAGFSAFGDGFNVPDATTIGHGWDEYLPDFKIISNQIVNLDAAAQEARITKHLGPNQSVSADCMVKEVGNSCGVMGRWLDPNNYYYLRLDAGQQNIRLMKKVGGVYTTLATANRSLTSETFYRLRLEIHQQQLQAFFADETTPAITVDDSSLAQGDFAGIRSYATAAAMTFFDNFEAKGDLGNRHFVTLPNLRSNTLYTYRVVVNGVTFGEGTFRSAKAPGSNQFNFVVFGDCGSGMPAQDSVAALMEKLSFSFGLIPGDVIYDRGTEAEFDPHYFTPYKNVIRHLPIFPVVGNHDVLDNNGVSFKSHFYHPKENLYYDFHWGDTHFIALDSTYASFHSPDPKQLAWLEQTLAASTAKWKIVYFHHPPYSNGEYGSESHALNNFVPLFEKYGVRVVFNGHAHSYERTHSMNGVTYIVTGGGGSPLTEVGSSAFTAFSASSYHLILGEMAGDTLTLKAIDPTGAVFDTVTIKR